MSSELRAVVCRLLKKCDPGLPSRLGETEFRLQERINKLQARTERHPGIPYWWWTPTGGKSLIANTFQSEGREHSPRWVNEYRPELVIDDLLATASYEVMNFGEDPLDAEVTVAGWLSALLDGPLYPPQGVEAFLREWCGAEAAA